MPLSIIVVAMRHHSHGCEVDDDLLKLLGGELSCPTITRASGTGVSPVLRDRRALRSVVDYEHCPLRDTRSDSPLMMSSFPGVDRGDDRYRWEEGCDG